LKLHLDNVNLSSNSGPNSFASKLAKYLLMDKCSITTPDTSDAVLCFIETNKRNFEIPMFQRLDGIYFNTAQNYNVQNRNIKRTYDMSDGIIFQSEFNRDLTFKYFGECENYQIIHNGADLLRIEQIEPLSFDRYENLWCCASSWRPHKRLDENIRYFLEHAGSNDGLMIAGDVPSHQRVKNDRIHYVGTLNQKQLFALYKKAKYFIHLSWLDHCPNVVVDARACGCQVICSSAGGTKEIAGKDAIVILEDEWDYKPIALYFPPKMNFSNKVSIGEDSEISMSKVSKEYKNFITRSINA